MAFLYGSSLYPSYNQPSPGSNYRLYGSNYGQPATYLPAGTSGTRSTTTIPSPQPINTGGGGQTNIPSSSVPLTGDTSQIDSIYSDIYNILNQQESNLRGGEQDLYATATQPYEAQVPILEQGKTQGLAQVASQQGDVRQQEANALAAARSLYDELRGAGRQRFGGSSSAGEFSNAILGREQQRNFGQIQNTAGQNIKALTDKATEINQNFTAQMQQLEIQKQAALAQARDLFRQRLDAIDQNRVQTAAAKAQAKYEELQNLRNQAFAIQQQNEAFRQNLQLQSQNALSQITPLINQYVTEFKQPTQTLSQAAPSYSTYGQNVGEPTSQLYQGNLARNKKLFYPQA